MGCKWTAEPSSPTPNGATTGRGPIIGLSLHPWDLAGKNFMLIPSKFCLWASCCVSESQHVCQKCQLRRVSKKWYHPQWKGEYGRNIFLFLICDMCQRLVPESVFMDWVIYSKYLQCVLSVVIYWRCVNRTMIWPDLWILCSITEGYNECFLLDCDVLEDEKWGLCFCIPSIKQVPYTSLLLNKSWLNEWKWRKVFPSVGRGKVGIRGCDLEAGRG